MSQCVRNSLGISSRRPASTLKCSHPETPLPSAFPHSTHIITAIDRFTLVFVVLCQLYSSIYRYRVETGNPLNEVYFGTFC